MAKLETKLTIESYSLVNLSEDELKMIFDLVSKVSGDPLTTYRKISSNIYNVIQEKTNWIPSSSENMIESNYSIRARVIK